MEAPFIYSIGGRWKTESMQLDHPEGDCACADIPVMKISQVVPAIDPRLLYVKPEQVHLSKFEDNLFFVFHPLFLTIGPYLMNSSAYQVLQYFKDPHTTKEAIAHFCENLEGYELQPILETFIEAGLISVKVDGM
jgi:hypothetical protein